MILAVSAGQRQENQVEIAVRALDAQGLAIIYVGASGFGVRLRCYPLAKGINGLIQQVYFRLNLRALPSDHKALLQPKHRLSGRAVFHPIFAQWTTSMAAHCPGVPCPGTRKLSGIRTKIRI